MAILGVKNGDMAVGAACVIAAIALVGIVSYPLGADLAQARMRLAELENMHLRERLQCREGAASGIQVPFGEEDMKTHFADDATLALIAKLEAENAALRDDAERYRWLRGNVFVDVIEDDGRYWTVRLGDEKELDAAIDAARKT